MSTVNVRIIGADKVKAKLERLGKELYNFSAELTRVGEELTAYYAGAFPMQGSQYGRPWDPLKPATIAYKTNHMGGMLAGVSPAQPLIFSGKMKDSFKFQAGPAALRVYNDVQSEKGYNYFKAHQLGLGHNPQRVMMMLNTELIEGIKTSIKEGLKARIEAA